ncbi:hypothetical protein C8N43_0151 [Litoreibacter ponti]|uniref:FAD-binding FR-type domain-containing protein n=1 Tax=Litoreibacter ponti TaxID=1510457 RepID=A0A2T6BHI1_9RHOB|nr:flavodoxin reductase [Litoreibacter ponti]PTX55512.1 hypothetical protein C8N43_0151 [Litoreibacter ponti]
MSHSVTLTSVEPITHNTYHLTMERPESFDFAPGQATELAIDKDGWRDEARPFTMTSQPEDPELSFVIKSYPDHDGVTEQVAKLGAGDTVMLDEPFGAIQDQGPGVFIAGGAGITPFIPILRKRAMTGDFQNSHLIFSNATEKDIILREEWEGYDGLETTFLVTEQENSPMHAPQLNKGILAELIDDFGQNFYLCGPKPMVKDVRSALKELGAHEDKIITEDGW